MFDVKKYKIYDVKSKQFVVKSWGPRIALGVRLNRWLVIIVLGYNFSENLLGTPAALRTSASIPLKFSSKCYRKHKTKPQLQPPFSSIVLEQPKLGYLTRTLISSNIQSTTEYCRSSTVVTPGLLQKTVEKRVTVREILLFLVVFWDHFKFFCSLANYCDTF